MHVHIVNKILHIFGCIAIVFYSSMFLAEIRFHKIKCITINVLYKHKCVSKYRYVLHQIHDNLLKNHILANSVYIKLNMFTVLNKNCWMCPENIKICTFQSFAKLCFLYSWRATLRRWTSSGPSASRRTRAQENIPARRKSSLNPAPPWA